MLTTKGKGTNQLLSLQDKAILCRSAEYRTSEEKSRLCKQIAGLKCFRRYPQHVKSQLAGVTYFVYYKPGHVIVREKQEAHATYLITSGEVNVSLVVFDPLFKEYVVKNLATMGPGDMFGEVSLLHDIPRTATITTLTDCELLQIKRVDFERVLKASVQEQWNKTQELMSHFEYFDNWDEVSVRECCILSRIVNFPEGSIVMTPNDANKNFVFFMTEGKCRIVEKMRLVETRDQWGVPKFEKYPKVTDTKSEKLNAKKSEEEFNVLTKPTTFEIPLKVTKKHKSNSDRVLPKVDSRWSPAKTEDLFNRSKSLATVPIKRTKAKTQHSPIPSVIDMKMHEGEHYDADSATSLENLPANVKTFFMQVCLLEKKACFGLTEQMHNRFVVADSPTECLLIPRYWIMQKNYQKIWDRIVGYMNRTIPSSDKVYKLFLEHRRWLIYRMKLFKELYRRQGCIFNNTSITDIPYWLRTNSEIDVDELYSYNYKLLSV